MADEPLQPLLDALQSSLVPPTRTAALLPSASDLSFERTLSRSLARQLDQESTRILSIAQSLIDWCTVEPNNEDSAVHGGGKKKGSGFELDEDLIKDGEYSNVVLQVEPLLEQADEAIELHLGTGKNRKQVGAVGMKSREELEQEASGSNRYKVERLPGKLLHDSSIEKPQKSFGRTKVEVPSIEDVSANGEGGIPLWKPILRRKLNPLKEEDSEGWLETELYEPESRFSAITATNPPSYTRYVHPYQIELEHLKPPSRLSNPLPTTPEAIPKDSFETTPFEWVGTEEALDKMVEEIRHIGESKGMKELAIDLEHHDYRAWAGMTCLIQLSTREKDYVIDTLNPGVRDSLEALNEFFTDPEWIKVLHGANSDVVWLQRDFGLYIVGLFDTYHATHVLGYPSHSLASLLDMYTDFVPDKRYQLADWRIRPLPKEMLHYARSDTHYLLTIYDHLRIALDAKSRSSPPATPSEPSPLDEVYLRSIGVSLKTFSIPPYDHSTGHFDSGYLIPLSKTGQLKSYATALAVPTLPIKTGWGPNEVKLEVLRNVMKWRETMARKEDESTRYVLGIDGVLTIVDGAKRIASENGGANELIRALGNARGGVSEIVRRRKEELVQVIRKTVEAVEGARLDQDQTMGDLSSSSAMLGSIGGLAAFEPVVKPIRGLWDESSSTPVASTSTSSFFGGPSKPSNAPTSATTIASSSTFFGPSSTPAKKSSKGKGKQTEDTQTSSVQSRLEAIQRVHESLVLGGGLAKSLQPHTIPTRVVAESAPTADPMPIDASSLPVQLEVPDASFVPFDSSSSASTSKALGSVEHSAPKPKDSDVIVVSSLKDKPSRSSQAQAKKRRRAGTDVDPTAETSTERKVAQQPEGAVSPPPQPPQAKKQKKKKTPGTSTDESTPPIVPHDYTGSTSLLDQAPAILTGLERRQAEKQQKKRDKAAGGKSGGGKGFKVDTSEHKRPMRVDVAPKRANVSKSFAK